jgi:hypothetical protein
MSTYRGELQDSLGNVLHPQTEAKGVYITPIPEINGCTTSQDAINTLSTKAQQMETDINSLKTVALSGTTSATITSQGNATQADVLSSKTFSNGSSVNLLGGMPNNGTLSKALNCGETFTVPMGYASGGTITANSLASQTVATATAADIISPKTAFVNGNKLTGSMISRAYQEYAVGTWTDGYGNLALKVPTGAYVTEGTFGPGYAAPTVFDGNFIASNILAGKKMFGLTGTGSTGVSASGTTTLSSNGSNKVFSITLSFVPKVITCSGSVSGALTIFSPNGITGTMSYPLQVGGAYYNALCTMVNSTYNFDAGYASSSGGMQGTITWNAYTW